jgi:hypothetical protein
MATFLVFQLSSMPPPFTYNQCRLLATWLTSVAPAAFNRNLPTASAPCRIPRTPYVLQRSLTPSTSGPCRLPADPAVFRGPCCIPQIPDVRQRSLPPFNGFCRLPAEPAVFLRNLPFSSHPSTIQRHCGSQRSFSPFSRSCHLPAAPAVPHRYMPCTILQPRSPSSGICHFPANPAIFQWIL